jgi:serine/threonine-protein kinase 40
MDRDTKEVTLTNFGLGKQLQSEDEQLRDQRGSPAYISPAVISGKPYLGKINLSYNDI